MCLCYYILNSNETYHFDVDAVYDCNYVITRHRM